MKQELKQIGLTEGEAKAYLALLKIGSSSAGKIVKESGVSYSKIYEVLGRLLEKGIISYNIKQKTKYFQAIEPERLLDFLNKKEIELKENKRLLGKIIPELQNLKDKKDLQESEIFTGINGIKTAYEILLKDADYKNPLLYFYIYDQRYVSTLDLFYSQLFHYFRKLNIKLRGISTIDFKNSKYYSKPPGFVDLRFIDFPLPSTIDLYKDKILQTIWGENPTGILINSKEVADNYRRYFNEVWKVAKK